MNNYYLLKETTLIHMYKWGILTTVLRNIYIKAEAELEKENQFLSEYTKPSFLGVEIISRF